MYCCKWWRCARSVRSHHSFVRKCITIFLVWHSSFGSITIARWSFAGYVCRHLQTEHTNGKCEMLQLKLRRVCISWTVQCIWNSGSKRTKPSKTRLMGLFKKKPLPKTTAVSWDAEKHHNKQLHVLFVLVKTVAILLSSIALLKRTRVLRWKHKTQNITRIESTSNKDFTLDECCSDEWLEVEFDPLKLCTHVQTCIDVMSFEENMH